MDEIFENAIITKMEIEECIKKFDPEIQEIFYNRYGKNMENLPDEMLYHGHRTINMLERLLRLGNTKHQKLILMRFGIATGEVATLQEVANEFQISRERVRMIENKFLRRGETLVRKKRLIDYLND